MKYGLEKIMGHFAFTQHFTLPLYLVENRDTLHLDVKMEGEGEGVWAKSEMGLSQRLDKDD